MQSLWNFCQNNLFWNFVKLIICVSHDSVVPIQPGDTSNVEETIQPGDTSNVEETSYFTDGFAFHKMFKSVARFVIAAKK